MSIKEYAKKNNFQIVGKLTRKAAKGIGAKFYIDEGGNEYYITRKGEAYIITAEGGVI